MRSVSVVSYNIRSCRGLDGRTSTQRIANHIGALNADVVALQEVGSRCPDTGRLAQLDALQAATGLAAVPGLTLLRLDCPCGTAVLTRLPVLSTRHIDLSIPGREPRGATMVSLNLAGTSLSVICTHFGLRASERRHQMKRLIASLSREELEADIAILAGDFNEWCPRSGLLRRLNDHFPRGSTRATFPSLLPFVALDRIWIRSRLPVDVAWYVDKYYRTRIASDHLPIRATVSLT